MEAKSFCLFPEEFDQAWTAELMHFHPQPFTHHEGVTEHFEGYG
jgi:hypothetical protein